MTSLRFANDKDGLAGTDKELADLVMFIARLSQHIVCKSMSKKHMTNSQPGLKAKSWQVSLVLKTSELSELSNEPIQNFWPEIHSPHQHLLKTFIVR